MHFMHFRGGCELRLDEIDAPLLKEFETYLFSSGVCANTVSFYLRVLRAIRNRAVRDNLVEAIPQLFSNVHTGIEKTRKRAVQENVILGLGRFAASVACVAAGTRPVPVLLLCPWNGFC